jgi:DNA adenine methylase
MMRQLGSGLRSKREVRPAYTLFYLDPPYWQTEGYDVPFPLEEYAAIAEAMRSMQGEAILSITGHPDIRRAFKGYSTERVGIDYTVAGRGQKDRGGRAIIRNF